jgi:menaquinone-specific isochorismate synthase
MTFVAASSTLTAHVERLGGAGAIDDLLAPLGAGGFAWLAGGGRPVTAIVTSGVAARVNAPDAHDVLATMGVERGDGVPAGVQPLAAGALGWDLDRSLTIPAQAIVVRDGEAFIVTVRPWLVDPEPEPVAGAAPRRYTVAAIESRDEWCRAVDDALSLLRADELVKVVLAREVEITADRALDLRAVLGRLQRDQPGCVVYRDADLVGASPEMLVARAGSTVRSRPMAGTAARRATVADDDAAVAQLVASAKDEHEHRLVVDAVVDALRALGARPAVAGPVAERFASLTHLVTDVTAELPGGPDAATLAALLHPTPAVGGTPTAAALDAIARLERFDRGTYAGPVGWVDAAGDGEFVVALRCANVRGSTARLVAGAGIVEGSDPLAEFEETQAKLEPVLRAILRP